MNIFQIIVLNTTVLFSLTGAVSQTRSQIERVDRGIITEPALTEISGLAVSRQQVNIIWVHNDSGNRNILWGLDSKTSKLVGSVRVTGAANRDWEDIAIGPGPVKGISCIYIADIGDNHKKRQIKEIYRFPEPDLKATNLRSSTAKKILDVIRFKYPDGIHNAEALLLDPETKDLYVITKTNASAAVYCLKYPQSLDKINVALKITELDIPYVTGGSISPDGNRILLKNYFTLFLWERSKNESLAQIFKKTPVQIKYIPEPQGEAVGWDIRSKGYYTISEQKARMPVHIFYYPGIAINGGNIED